MIYLSTERLNWQLNDISFYREVELTIQWYFFLQRGWTDRSMIFLSAEMLNWQFNDISFCRDVELTVQWYTFLQRGWTTVQWYFFQLIILKPVFIIIPHLLLLMPITPCSWNNFNGCHHVKGQHIQLPGFVSDLVKLIAMVASWEIHYRIAPECPSLNTTVNIRVMRDWHIVHIPISSTTVHAAISWWLWVVGRHLLLTQAEVVNCSTQSADNLNIIVRAPF